MAKDQKFVKFVQTLLADHGLYAGRIDGRAGDLTREGLRQVQRRMGFKVTGTATTETVEALKLKVLPELNVPMPRPKPGPDMAEAIRRAPGLAEADYPRGADSARPNPTKGRLTLPGSTVATPEPEPIAEARTKGDTELAPDPDPLAGITGQVPGDPDRDLDPTDPKYPAFVDAKVDAIHSNTVRAMETPPLNPADMPAYEAGAAMRARKKWETIIRGSRYDEAPARPALAAPERSPGPSPMLGQDMDPTADAPVGNIGGLPDDAPGDDRVDQALLARMASVENDMALDWLAQDEFKPKAGGPKTDYIGDMWRAVQAEFAGTAQAAEAEPPPAAEAEEDPLKWLLGEKDESKPTDPPTPTDDKGNIVGGPESIRLPNENLPDVKGGFKSMAEDVVSVPRQAVGGVRDAAQAMLDFIGWVAEEGVSPVAETVGLPAMPEGSRFTLPEVSEPTGILGSVTRVIAQFATGFGIAGKVLGAIGKTSKIGKVARTLAQGGLADFLAFQPDEARLSDLVQEFPALQNPVTEYLKADPMDGEAEGRFKNAMEGLIVGPALEGFMKMLRVIRAARTLRKKASPLLQGKAVAAAAKANALPTAPARDMMLLGSPDMPVTVLKSEADQGASKIVAAVDETAAGVPDQVVAKSLTTEGLTPLGNGEVYINFAKIDSPEAIQKVINDTATAFRPELEEAARGVRTHGQTIGSAQEIDAFDALMKRRTGQPLNAETSYAARELWAASAAKLQEVASIAARDPSPEALFQFRKMLATFHAIQKEVIGARTETARALNAWKIPAGASKLQMDAMERALAAYGGNEVSQELAKKLALMTDPNAVSAFVEKSVYAKSRDAVQELWINAILSGPKTHLTNIISNTGVMGLSMMESAVAARIGRVFGGDEVVEVGEAMAQAYGMVASFKDALRNAAKTAKSGETGFYKGAPGIEPGKYLEGARERAISSTAWNLRSDSWYGKAVDTFGSVVNIPGRALQSEDEFFKTIGYRMALHQMAYRQVAKEIAEGMPKDLAKERLAQLIANPSEDMALEATAKAAYQTFTDEPGKIVKWLNQGRTIIPELKFVVPFVQTPANIFKFTFERSPLAPLTKRYRAAVAQGGAAADLARAKMALGTSAMMVAMDLCFNGSLTGSGPTDNPAELANLRRTGWQPYSVKIGDKYYAYNRLDPLGSLLSYGGDLCEAISNDDSPEGFGDGVFGRAFAAAVFSTAETVTSKTYMQGLSDLAEAVNDPTRYAESYVKRFAASFFVPAAVREVKSAMDPVQRETATIIDEIKSRLPGFSETLPPRRDLWGRPISFQSGIGPLYDALSPIYGSSYKPEPIDLEMQQDGWFLGAPEKSFTINGERVPLKGRPDIYSRYLELQGTTKPSDFGKPQAFEQGAFNLKVIDGDTIILNGERIRIVNISAPELKGEDADAGAMTASRLEELLKSGRITVDRRGEDRYQRTLAAIAVNELDVGETLIEEGLAGTFPGSEAKMALGERLIDRYGDRTMLEVLNAVVTGEDERSAAYDELETAEDREDFLKKIVADYRKAARSVLFIEYPDLVEQAAHLKELKRGRSLEPVD